MDIQWALMRRHQPLYLRLHFIRAPLTFMKALFFFMRNRKRDRARLRIRAEKRNFRYINNIKLHRTVKKVWVYKVSCHMRIYQRYIHKFDMYARRYWRCGKIKWDDRSMGNAKWRNILGRLSKSTLAWETSSRNCMSYRVHAVLFSQEQICKFELQTI